MKAYIPDPRTLISTQVLILLFSSTVSINAQRRRPPSGGRIAIVADERLSALRATPDLSGKLLQRVSRGRLVAIYGRKLTLEGIVFYRVGLSRRTRGWLQKEAVVSPTISTDDQRLFALIQASEGFDRLARAQLFLGAFPRSRLRPNVLWIYGDEAEAAATRLSRDAIHKLDQTEIPIGGAPHFSYFLNYSGLDRYNRQGVRFLFNAATKEFHYNGAAWQEIVKRYPHSAAALEARIRLDLLRKRLALD